MLNRFRRVGRRQDTLETRPCRPFAGRDRLKSGDPREPPWRDDLPVHGGITVGYGWLSASSDIDSRSNPVDELRLAEIPTVGDLRIEQTWKHKLSAGIDDLGVRGVGDLPVPRHRGDLVALDYNHRVSNRRASVAVNQGAPFNYKGRRRLRLGQVHTREDPEQNCSASSES